MNKFLLPLILACVMAPMSHATQESPLEDKPESRYQPSVNGQVFSHPIISEDGQTATVFFMTTPPALAFTRPVISEDGQTVTVFIFDQF